MPNSSVAITPGAGANIAVNVVSGLDMQVIKADWGGDGVSIPASSDGTHGLDVHVKLVDGAVTVNNPTAANLQVSIPGNVSIVATAGPIAVETAANKLSVSLDSYSVTIPVSGDVTAAQGTPAAASAPWPIEITDGTNGVAAISTPGGVKCLNVNVLESSSSGDIADDATFTEGTTLINPIGGEYNTAAGAATSGKAAACQITQYRGLHVNLRASAGTEIGTSGAPLRVDPVGTTTQPISGNVGATLADTTNAGAPVVQVNYNTAGSQELTVVGIGLPANGGAVAGGTATNPIRVDPTGTTTQPVNVGQVLGTAISAANPLPSQLSVGDAAVTAVSAGAGNPLPTLNQPTPAGFWKNALAFTASQTAQALHTPTSGKTGYIEGFVITVTGSGEIQIYDGTNSAANLLYQGTPPVGGIVHVIPALPIPQSAINNVLRYTTGASATGDLAIWGYDA